MTSPQIAIIGAGFAGLAACWELLSSNGPVDIALFDPNPPGQSTSGLSSGMLHPYAGKRALKSPRADEGILATRRLLDVAAGELGRPVYQESGILRFPTSPEQKEAFAKCAELQGDVAWWSQERCQELLPKSCAWEAIFIRSGLTVDSAAYLEGLWRGCARRGARFVQKAVGSLEELSDFDLVILAAGAASDRLTGPIAPNIHTVKGQILILRWPGDVPPPPMTITCQQHLVMIDGGEACLVGATYEHPPFPEGPEVETARRLLLHNLARLYPHLLNAEILDCRAGLRASLPSHQLPSLIRVDERTWRFAGLGSKGLLYHALLISEQLRANDLIVP